MGRFSCLVLVLAAACGDNGVVDPDDGAFGGIDHPPSHDGSTTSKRLVPSVCGANEWTAKFSNPKVELSVATRANDAAITTLPIGGGDVSGALVDRRMQIVKDGTLGMGTFDSMSLTYKANRFVSTGIANDTLFVNLLQDDLSSRALVTKVPATAISKPAFFDSYGDVIMPVGDYDGVTVYRFADSFEPAVSAHVATTKRVRSMTAAQYGASTIASWSTDGECYMMRLGTGQSELTKQNMPCLDSRLALDQSTGGGILVFNGKNGVNWKLTQDAQLEKSPVLVRPDTYAPRALFDGTHFWISMLDARGQIIVGILNDNLEFVTSAVVGPHPTDAAYELTMLDGSPWVFAVDENGYTGNRLCAVAE